jgi:hypothetical protein
VSTGRKVVEKSPTHGTTATVAVAVTLPETVTAAAVLSSERAAPSYQVTAPSVSHFLLSPRQYVLFAILIWILRSSWEQVREKEREREKEIKRERESYLMLWLIDKQYKSATSLAQFGEREREREIKQKGLILIIAF